MPAQPLPPQLLALDLRKQLKSEWCWAAVTQSIELFFTPSSDLTQCRIVGRNFNKDCCPSASDPDIHPTCNRPWFLHRALDDLGLLRRGVIDGPITFARLRREVDAGRPVCVLIRWKSSGLGHFIVIHGYSVSAQGKKIVFLQDPLEPAPTRVFYSRFASGNTGDGYQDGQGEWFGTILVKRKSP